MATQTAEAPADKTTEPTLPQSGGMSAEQKRLLLAAAGKYKHNPDFIARGQAQVAEYRKQLQEELERELADAGK